MKIYISLWNIYLVETWWHFFVLKFICFYSNMHLTFWTGSSNYIIKIICHIWNMVNIEQKMVLHAHLLMFQYPVKVLFAFTVYIFCCLLLIYFQIILTFGVIYLIYVRCLFDFPGVKLDIDSLKWVGNLGTSSNLWRTSGEHWFDFHYQLFDSCLFNIPYM